MASTRRAGPPRPLLSVGEAAILLGTSRSSLYRSIERCDLPLPVWRFNGRLRIARRAAERLIAGETPVDVASDDRHQRAPAGAALTAEPP